MKWLRTILGYNTSISPLESHCFTSPPKGLTFEQRTLTYCCQFIFSASHLFNLTLYTTRSSALGLTFNLQKQCNMNNFTLSYITTLFTWVPPLWFHETKWADWTISQTSDSAFDSVKRIAWFSSIDCKPMWISMNWSSAKTSCTYRT